MGLLTLGFEQEATDGAIGHLEETDCKRPSTGGVYL